MHKTRFALLDDVDLTGLTDGDFFKYDAASGKIIRTVAPGGGGGGGGGENIAIGKTYTLSVAPNGSYPDAITTASRPTSTAFATRGGMLTDGERGTPEDFTTYHLGWQADPAVRLDFDAAVSGSKVRAWGMFGSDVIYRPLAAKLEYSDDDATYTTVENRTGLTDGGAPGRQRWMVEFDVSGSGSHRYWRVTLTHQSSGSGWLFVSEIEFIT